MLGFWSKDEQGWGKAKKRTGFLTSSEFIGVELGRSCDGSHRHVDLVQGRAKAAEAYPRELCEGILKGVGEGG